MREILFRGKRLKDGAWIEGFYCEFANNMSGEQEHFIQTVKSDGRIDTLYRVDPSTVGQYTGLTDKNGERIFEGDIVRVFLRDGVEVGPIMWSDIDARYKFASPDGTTYSVDCTCVFEKIGNIHDNPELLEGGADNG